jgi:F420-dependent methylenetetrahydromethanopterin dehydrogenase
MSFTADQVLGVLRSVAERGPSVAHVMNTSGREIVIVEDDSIDMTLNIGYGAALIEIASASGKRRTFIDPGEIVAIEVITQKATKR